MTKFLTFFNLYPVSEPEKFLGVAADKFEDNVIVTLSHNTVVIINIKTQKQVLSWTTVEKLSLKVIYDFTINKYIGIFNDRILRFWDETFTDFGKAEKIEFDKDVALMVNNKQNTYILLTNGTLVDCQKPLIYANGHKQIMSYNLKLKRHMINNASLVCPSNGRKVIIFFETDKDRVELFQLYLDDGTMNRFVLNRGNLDTKIAGYTVMEGKTFPTLITMWSDKRIFMFELHEELLPEKSPGKFVSMLLTLNTERPLSIYPISENFVAIYGSNSRQEGASLLLYNTQFRVIKTQQLFKVYFKFSRLSALNDHLLIAMGPNLAVVKFHTAKEIFSELVGTQINNNFKSPLEADPINEEDSLQYNVQLINSKTKFNLKNGNIFVNYQDFKTEESYNVLDFLNQTTTHVDVLDNNCDKVDISVISQFNNIRELGSSIIGQLEHCGASQHEITEKLIIAFIKSDSSKKIDVACRKYTNVSEKLLANILRYALCNCENKLEIFVKSKEISDSNVNQTEIASTNQTYFSKLLNLLLMTYFDFHSIIPHLHSNFGFYQIFLLLKYLHGNMPSSDLLFFKTSPDLKVPSGMQMLHWLTVLLYSHYSTMAISKNNLLLSLLSDWNLMLQNLKREFRSLSETQSLLHKILCHDMGPLKFRSKLYNIHELTLY